MSVGSFGISRIIRFAGCAVLCLVWFGLVWFGVKYNIIIYLDASQ